MIVVNFSHPLSESQRQQLESLCGQAITRTIDVAVQCAHAEPFAEQASSIVSSSGLSDATGTGRAAIARIDRSRMHRRVARQNWALSSSGEA